MTAILDRELAVEMLVTHLRATLPGTQATPTPHTYGHIGATLCDAGLQAGINYRTVVAPRVQRLLAHWPRATTVSVFLGKVDRYGLHDVLRWRDSGKLERIELLARALQRHDIDTEGSLRDWLLRPEADRELIQLRGIGPKTIDYIKLLVGIPAIAVDRHLRRFLATAGIDTASYTHARELWIDAAHALSLAPSVLDRAVWARLTEADVPGRIDAWAVYGTGRATPLAARGGVRC